MQDTKLPKGANGLLPLALGLRGALFQIVFVGGPFDSFYRRTVDDFGVCVRAERVPPSAHVNLPIKDFQVPTDRAKVEEVLIEAFKAAIDGKKVWVGCMGGWGRTGLFLALAAKAAGYDDPIAYVRETYTPRAVETVEQEVYVEEFDVSAVQAAVNRYAWRARLPRFLRWLIPA